MPPPAASDETAPAVALARRVVRGGGAQILTLKAGDTVMVCDPEGLQPALVFAAPATALRSAGAAPVAGALSDYVAATVDWPALREALDGLGREPAELEGVGLLPAAAPAGALARFHATEDLVCVIVAPGEATTPVGQATPTDLDLYIDAQARVSGWGGEPLAAPKAEFLVKAASTQAYSVAAGDYIQVMDVEGRQCSDFLAFDAKALSEGREQGLDPTVTRTLMGLSSPAPGLHGKYFDSAMQPLVEIVQDTVGRHDTFLMACAAKYYDDAGYPGHANCTDNFNAVLEPLGVRSEERRVGKEC